MVAFSEANALPERILSILKDFKIVNVSQKLADFDPKSFFCCFISLGLGFSLYCRAFWDLSFAFSKLHFGILFFKFLSKKIWCFFCKTFSSKNRIIFVSAVPFLKHESFKNFMIRLNILASSNPAITQFYEASINLQRSKSKHMTSSLPFLLLPSYILIFLC